MFSKALKWFLGYLRRQGNAIYKTLCGWAALWATRAAVMAYPSTAIAICKTVAKVAYQPPAAWAGFLESYMEQMTGKRIRIEDLMRKGARVGGAPFMEAIGEEFLKPMLGLVLPEPPMTWRKAFDGAERFLGVNLQFQLNAWLLHFLGDIFTFGKIKSLKDLPNAISWSYGIGWLSWLVMGTPFRKAISEPLERYFNRVYLQQQLTAHQAVRAYIMGELDRDAFQAELLELGYTPEKIAALYRLEGAKFSEAELRRLWEERVIGEGDVEAELRERGVPPEKLRYAKALVLKDRVLRLRDDVLQEAEDLFVRGGMTEREFRGYLEAAKWTEEEIELAVARARLRKAQRGVPTPAQIRAAYRAGYISEAEARSMLMAQGYSDMWAGFLLRR